LTRQIKKWPASVKLFFNVRIEKIAAVLRIMKIFLNAFAANNSGNESTG
jgi:hypothetical protein